MENVGKLQTTLSMIIVQLNAQNQKLSLLLDLQHLFKLHVLITKYWELKSYN